MGPLWIAFERRAVQLAKQGTVDPQIDQFRWLLEEPRVSLYAQELRTPDTGLRQTTAKAMGRNSVWIAWSCTDAYLASLRDRKIWGLILAPPPSLVLWIAPRFWGACSSIGCSDIRP